MTRPSIPVLCLKIGFQLSSVRYCICIRLDRRSVGGGGEKGVVWWLVHLLREYQGLLSCTIGEERLKKNSAKVTKKTTDNDTFTQDDCKILRIGEGTRRCQLCA